MPPSPRLSARKKIAELELQLEEKRGSLTDLTKKIEDTAKAQPRASQLDPQFLEAKAKLRELLDISSDEHKQRQQDLTRLLVG